MCRNITTLRGLEPPATSEEIEAAARQYVRKVTGVQSLSDATREPFEAAVREGRRDHVPPARRAAAAAPAPTTVPPLRRADVQARIAAPEAHERAHELGSRTSTSTSTSGSREAQRTRRGMPCGGHGGEREERASARCRRMCSSSDHVGPFVSSMPHAHAMVTRPWGW